MVAPSPPVAPFSNRRVARDNTRNNQQVSAWTANDKAGEGKRRPAPDHINEDTMSASARRGGEETGKRREAECGEPCCENELVSRLKNLI